jgi:hypothetical protein
VESSVLRFASLVVFTSGPAGHTKRHMAGDVPDATQQADEADEALGGTRWG